MSNTLNKTELSYLSGLLDGDGCFTISKKVRNNLKLSMYFAVTSKTLLEKMKNLLEGLGIERVKVSVSESKGNRKTAYYLRVDTLKDNQKLLESVAPYLIGKKQTAEIALRFAIRRQQMKRTSVTERDAQGRILHVKNDRFYCADDFNDYESVKRLNGVGMRRVVKDDLRSPVLIDQASETDLAYLAGLFDAEGGFSVVKRQGRYNGCKFNYEPSCYVVNCDTSIINAVLKTLRNLGTTKYCLSQVKARSDNESDGYRVSISNLTTLDTFLPNIIPYLHGKSCLAALLQEYVKSRLNARTQKGSSCKTVYSERDIDIYNQMRELNARGKNSIIDRAATEQSVVYESCELLETPNSEMRRTISSEVPLNRSLISGKRSTTIPPGSRVKRLEAQDFNNNVIVENDIV